MASVGSKALKARTERDDVIRQLRRFGTLTRPQRGMLAFLDDGVEEDSVGVEAEELTSCQIAMCERLVGKDLVRFDIGWRYSCWFRLTPAGRDALQALRAARRANP